MPMVGMVGLTDSAGRLHRFDLVDSLEDPRLAPFVGSKDRSLRLDRAPVDWQVPHRPREGYFVAESDLVITRAVAAGFQPLALVVHEGRQADLPFPIEAETPCLIAISASLAQAIAGSDHVGGALALFVRPSLPAVEELLEGDRLPRSLLLLAGVTNPINMGVMCRSAAALGVDAVVVDRRAVDPFYRRCSRVAMGEVFGLNMARGGEAVEVIRSFAEHSVTTVGLSPAVSAVDIRDAMSNLSGHNSIALVLGAEGPGLSEDELQACSVVAKIPIQPRVDSLNVGAAAAIAIWELVNA